MRLALVALAACGGDREPAAPAVASGSAPAPAITAELVGCSAALAAPVDPRESALAPSTSPPRFVVDYPRVAGSLRAPEVWRFLRLRIPDMRACYETALAAQPRLSGVVEVGFAVQPNGKVASVRADGVDAALAKCIADVVKQLELVRPPDNDQVQVTVAIELAPTSNPFARPRVAAAGQLRQWTPFAVEPPSVSTATVESVTAAVRPRMNAIENCFDGARGAVRAMLAFDATGRTELVRAGGIGDSAIEACISKALDGISAELFEPERSRAPHVEVACDFTRGGDAPLRVSPDAGYTIIELTSREARSRSSVREIPPRGTHQNVTMLGTTSAVLVIAEPDAPAHGLEFALWWAPAGTTLVAVKASGGAPVFLGMGDSRAKRRADTTKRVLQLRTDRGQLRACVPGSELTDTAPLLDPRAVDRVMSAAVAACKQTSCEPNVVVGTSGELVAKELVATTSAARRAGFHQVIIGGPACD